MGLLDLLKPRTGKRRKVRRMGNFSTYVEIYIYVLAALVLLGSLVISLMSKPW